MNSSWYPTIEDFYRDDPARVTDVAFHVRTLVSAGMEGNPSCEVLWLASTREVVARGRSVEVLARVDGLQLLKALLAGAAGDLSRVRRLLKRAARGTIFTRAFEHLPAGEEARLPYSTSIYDDPLWWVVTVMPDDGEPAILLRGTSGEVSIHTVTGDLVVAHVEAIDSRLEDRPREPDWGEPVERFDRGRPVGPTMVTEVAAGQDRSTVIAECVETGWELVVWPQTGPPAYIGFGAGLLPEYVKPVLTAVVHGEPLPHWLH